MGRTIFYQQLVNEKNNEIPITFLLVEVLEALQDSLEELDSYAALQVAVEWAGLIEAGQVVSEQQANSLITRLNDGANQPPKEVKAGSAGRAGKRTFASEFLKSYEKLSIADKCLFAADYDYDVARRLYCVYDKAVSEGLIRKHFDMAFSRMQMDYEAVVFGMGGSFGKGSSEPEGEVIDFAPDPSSADYLSAAQDFVNMQKSYRSKAR